MKEQKDRAKYNQNKGASYIDRSTVSNEIKNFKQTEEDKIRADKARKEAMKKIKKEIGD